jgi:HK97 family phage major capsid protein
MLTSSGVINPIRDLARVETIVGKEWQGVTSAGTTVARAGEAAAATASQFTLGQPKVRTNRVQGYTVFSLEIDLSWNALRSEITKMLVDAKQHEENSFITGTGDGITDGSAPQGINGGLTSANDTEANLAGAFVLGDLYALEEGLDARWEGNASYLAHKTVVNAIRQFPTDNAGSIPGSLNNVFVNSLQAGNPSQLLDSPLYRSTGMPTLAAAQASSTHSDGTDTLMIYGDFKQFLIVDRIGMTVEMVPTVVNSSGFPTGQRGVYCVWMNNSKILIPGAFRRLINGDNTA